MLVYSRQAFPLLFFNKILRLWTNTSDKRSASTGKHGEYNDSAKLSTKLLAKAKDKDKLPKEYPDLKLHKTVLT